MTRIRRIAALAALAACCAAAGGPPARAQSGAIRIDRALAVPVPRTYAEVIVAPNPVDAALALGTWAPPVAGQSVAWPGKGSARWRAIAAGESGWFEDSVLAGCWVYAPVESKRKRVVILEAKGNEIAYVNGIPRAGNPYCLKDDRESWEPRFDYGLVPVALEKGRNDLLFRCARGRLKVLLEEPERPVFLNDRDVTVPDLVVGERVNTEGAIVVVNATTKPLRDLVIEVELAGGAPVAADVPLVEKLAVRKVRFPIRGAAPAGTGTVRVGLSLRRNGGGGADRIDYALLDLRAVEPGANRKVTFVSEIDGSLQYYAVNPAAETSGAAAAAADDAPKALVLSLHGASVEAINQSGSYEPKTWAHIVAPTNRRPYGFNWEEWGRLDVFEVLKDVNERFRIDPSRVYVTGHSMGGHGTWHFAALYPDLFAAAAPSAGWISFWTYRFRGLDLGDESPARALIRRSTTPSETFRHVDNLARLGVYILHGADDDNVPASEARSMAAALDTAGVPFVYHEQPGAGHWWDLSDEPGADCVDWPPLFDFLARHVRPERTRVREVHFLTSNPGVSSRCDWLAIDAQERQLAMSRADVRFDPETNRFVGATDNVSRLALSLGPARADAPVAIELDGQKLTLTARESGPGGERLWLWKTAGRWGIGGKPWPEYKGAARYGTFKEIFRNHLVFVYGTKGGREENAWAYGKARYDAEKLWYQGNGSVEVVADVDFRPAAEPDVNVVLYGNASTNAAWKKLLGESPVQVKKGSVEVDGRRYDGKDLCCIFVRPRAGSAAASVAAVSGTGVVGMRVANRLPYLNPGIGLPDCVVFDSRILTSGDDGVLLAGFFGLDWSVGEGEFYRKP